MKYVEPYGVGWIIQNDGLSPIVKAPTGELFQLHKNDSVKEGDYVKFNNNYEIIEIAKKVKK